MLDAYERYGRDPHSAAFDDLLYAVQGFLGGTSKRDRALAAVAARHGVYVAAMMSSETRSLWLAAEEMVQGPGARWAVEHYVNRALTPA